MDTDKSLQYSSFKGLQKKGRPSSLAAVLLCLGAGGDTGTPVMTEEEVEGEVGGEASGEGGGTERLSGMEEVRGWRY